MSFGGGPVRKQAGYHVIRIHGPEWKYDHAQIRQYFREKRSNTWIAEKMGCNRVWVWELRKKYERGKMKC